MQHEKLSRDTTSDVAVLSLSVCGGPDGAEVQSRCLPTERRGALEERAGGRAGASGGITPGATPDSGLIRSPGNSTPGGELRVCLLKFWD